MGLFLSNSLLDFIALTVRTICYGNTKKKNATCLYLSIRLSSCAHFLFALQLQTFTFKRFLSLPRLLPQVRRVLQVLEKPFTSQPGLEFPSWVGGAEAANGGERDEGEEAQQEASASTSAVPPARNAVAYDSKPPTWANEICVT